MKSVITFPAIPDAPHWRPTTLDEIAKIAGEISPPGTFDFTPGWDLAFFTVAQTGAPRVTVLGWVKDSFAVTECPVGPESSHLTGGLIHLSTGYRVAMFLTAEEAAFAAETIADCTDWSTITPDTVRAIGRDVLDRLANAGFDRFVLATGHGGQEVMSRRFRTEH